MAGEGQNELGCTNYLESGFSKPFQTVERAEDFSAAVRLRSAEFLDLPENFVTTGFSRGLKVVIQFNRQVWSLLCRKKLFSLVPIHLSASP